MAIWVCRRCKETRWHTLSRSRVDHALLTRFRSSPISRLIETFERMCAKLSFRTTHKVSPDRVQSRKNRDKKRIIPVRRRRMERWAEDCSDQRQTPVWSRQPDRVVEINHNYSRSTSWSILGPAVNYLRRVYLDTSTRLGDP